MKIIDLEQGTPEWHAWRTGKMTASNAAAVIGWDKYKTAYQLWNEMTLRVKAFEGNAFTEAGTAMEPKARACYEVEHDFADMRPVCIEHEVHSEIGASLDGLRFPDHKIILEIKYPSEESHNLAIAGEVPRHYIPQIQHQLMCAPEVEEAHYWSFRDGKGVKVPVKPDLELQALILRAELAFLELVKSDTPPPLTDHDVKLVDTPEIAKLCQEIIERSCKPEKKIDGIFPVKKGKDKSLDALKAKAVELAGHPKMKCGRVQVSTVLRKGVFSYHKLTIGEGA